MNYDNYTHSNWTDYDDSPSLQTRLAFASAWIFIAVAGIIGNSLVIYVAIRFQKMNNVTNCFIVNLAVTDIVFLVFCMPLLVIQYTLEHWSFDQLFCKLLNFISFISVLVTVLTLVAMTIDRYIYVVRPFENIRWRKPKTVFLFSLFIWLISCVLASPFFHEYGVITIEENIQQCVLRSEDHLQKYFRLYTVTLYYFIPLTIIVLCYTKLLYYVFAKENKIQAKVRQSVKKWSKKRRAVTKMVAIVTLVFSVCWLPITIYIVSANFFIRKNATLYYFKVIANSCAYLNSAINPILYALLNRSFRTNCGSLFADPTCPLFCTDDQKKNSYQQRPLHKLPTTSTQLDRLSYQSTRRSSSPVSRRHRKRRVIILDHSPTVRKEGPSQNDPTDVEYDPFEHQPPNGTGENCVYHNPHTVEPTKPLTIVITTHTRSTSL